MEPLRSDSLFDATSPVVVVELADPREGLMDGIVPVARWSRQKACQAGQPSGADENAKGKKKSGTPKRAPLEKELVILF